jgi:hypothetical protein
VVTRGVRAWWEATVAGGRWYEVVVSDVRLLPSDRFAILGEIRDRGEPINPWEVLVRVRNGLIIESPSYLSEKALLENLRLLRGPSTAR